MNRWMIAAIMVVCVLLLKLDAGTFAIPAAFILCILALWKRGFAVVQEQLNGYRQDIEKRIMDAESMMLSAQDFLESAQKTERDLIIKVDTILQLAHQDAAGVWKKWQTEMDELQEDQHRKIELQSRVLHQKWRLSMGQDLIISMRSYISSPAMKLPDSNDVLMSISNKAHNAIEACDVLPKSIPGRL